MEIMEFNLLFIFLALGGFAAGFFGGLVGVGGGWLIVPLLTVAGFPPVQAIAISFTQMAPTTFMGALQHYRYGNLKIRPSLFLAIGMLIGISIGTYILDLFKTASNFSPLYRIGYIFFLFAAAGSMMYRRKMSNHATPLSLPNGTNIGTIGISAGVISGFFGVGGGVVSVPLLVRMHQLPIKQAVASSLSAISFCSLLMCIKYWAEGYSNLYAAFAILSGSLIGSYLGSKATQYFMSKMVIKLFASLITVTALTLVIQFYSVMAGQIFLFSTTTVLTMITLIFYANAKKTHALNQ